MRSSFEADRKKYIQREKEFTKKLAQELRREIKHLAASEDGWASLLRIYAKAPHYSPQNMLFARAQLRAKGAPEEGLIFSESAWKALGRRIKPEYRRSYKSDDDGNILWDDSLAAEMLAPMIVTKKLPGDGADEERETSVMIGFRVFDVYHEDATEPYREGEGEIPRASWFEARGPAESAAALWADIERICEWQGVSLNVAPPRRSIDRQVLDPLPKAHLDRAGKRLTVTSSDNLAEQAAAALGAVLDLFGPDGPPSNDEEAKARILARESAKYAIASLYGLETQRQSFAFLKDVGADDALLKKTLDDVHARVSRVLNHLDPVLRAKARGEEQMKARHAGRKSLRSRQKRARRAPSVDQRLD
jgi:hypothetical protein